MLAALEQVQGMTERLSDTLEGIRQIIDSSAKMIGEVEVSHQKILSDINTQVDTANAQIDVVVTGVNGQIDTVNGQISSSVNSVNTQIDNAISVIQAAADSGSLDAAAANQAIESLHAAKVSQKTINQISGVTIDAIQMPKENTAVQGTVND